MKTTKMYLHAILTAVLGVALTLINANQGDKITSLSQLEGDSLLNFNSEIEATEIEVSRDLLKTLPGISINWMTWGVKFELLTFELEGETRAFIYSKPLWGNKAHMPARSVSRGASAELDGVLSEYESSSGESVGEYVLVGQATGMQFMGSVFLLAAVFMYILTLYINIKFRRLAKR